MRLFRVACHVAVCGGVALLVGCAKADAPADSLAVVPAEGTTSASAGAVAPAPIALSEIAGNWKFRATPQSGTDTSATEFTLTSTGTTEGWKFTFANGLVVPVTVTASGDSVITSAGPYKSVRRKGVDVTTTGAFRREGDRLVGTTVARYSAKGADSVMTFRSEGVRAP